MILSLALAYTFGAHGTIQFYGNLGFHFNIVISWYPNTVSKSRTYFFNFLKYLEKAQNTFNSSICLSVRLSQNQTEGSNNRLAKAGSRRPDALPAGLVGFSAGRRLQKLSSAPRALARLKICFGTTDFGLGRFK